MLLVVETALAALSVALLDGERIVAEDHRLVGRGHAETLMSAIVHVVGERGGEVSAILVDTGPGSFTGLRVGIAAARALGLAWGVPVTGVGSLTLIAAGAFAADIALDRVAVVVDAGRGQVYTQCFERLGCTPEGVPQAMAVAELHLPAGIPVAGSGTALVTGHRPVGTDVPRSADARFVPSSLRTLAPTPLYLRAPDAVAA